jgi:hypothetical protein
MANYRQIHVSIWKDEWFLDLEPAEKLLFIYLFSNEATSLAGIYKLPMKVIEFETGLDRKFIEDTLSKFQLVGKALYENGIVWVTNMRRYHETKSSKVQTRILSDIALIPDCPLKIRYLYGMDTRPQLKEEEEEKEEEKEKEYVPTSASDAVRVFADVTGMITIPGREDDRAYAIESILQLARLHGGNTKQYLAGFYNAWIQRNYGKTNIHWLDWAIAGEIPVKKAPKPNKDKSLDEQLAEAGYTAV